MSSVSAEKWVLQLCHGYGAPFDDVARQWAALFKGSAYRVLTVFLTGESCQKVTELVGGDRTVFLQYHSSELRGLKRRQIRDIRRLHSEYGFALTIAHRYKPIYIASHLPGVPVYGVAHAYDVFAGFWRRFHVTRHRQQLHLIAVSDAVRRNILADLPSFPPARVHTVYNRIDMAAMQRQQLDREQARIQLGLSDSAWIVGNVGRLHPDKDQHTLLRGFAAALPELGDEAQLVIVGTGRLEAELKQLAEALGISDRVCFTGRVPDAWKYFKAFDVFALTSRNEPFGMVVLEALAAGVPVVVADSGGAPEIVGDTGIVFETGNPQSLAAALCCKPVFNRELEQRLQQQFSDEAGKQRFWGLRG